MLQYIIMAQNEKKAAAEQAAEFAQGAAHNENVVSGSQSAAIINGVLNEENNSAAIA